MPEITIIVPVFNTEKNLRKCIESIAYQTFTDFECILINDESSDNCPEICDEYAQKDKRIIVIHQKNSGVSAARNAGIEIARGRWLGFVDSDDWCELGHFQFLYETAHKENADISICGWHEIYENNFFDAPDKRKGIILDSNNAILELLDIESFGGYSWNKLVKSELFHGVRYDTTVKTMSDVLVFYEIFKRAKKIVYSPEPYYNYVQNHDSIVHKHGLAKRASGLSIWDKMLAVETNETIREKITMRKIEYASRICYEEVNNYNDDLYAIFSSIAKKNIFYILTRLPISLKSKLSRIFCLIFPRLYILLQKVYRVYLRREKKKFEEIYRKILLLSLPKFFGELFLLPKHIIVFINFLLNDKKHFKYELSIAAIARNEAPYILEWIEYHRIVGVEHFYIYDNESVDNLKDILQPYINSGIVTYTYFPGRVKQGAAYNDAIKHYKNEMKWLAIIDINEFIAPVKTEKIIDAINEIKSSLRQKPFICLKIHWVRYGYCGHKTKPKGLVIENYTKSEGIHETIKCIVNPRTVVEYHEHHGDHFFWLSGINENGVKIKKHKLDNNTGKVGGTNIRVNYYFTKSYEEFSEKTARGFGFVDKPGKYDLPPFDPDYLSGQEDFIMKKYVSLVKEQLEKQAI
jgi:glycosyltransferase involved in cell wall biosynthesis